MTAEPSRTVRDLFVEVMRAVRVIEKSSYNKDQHYKFRGIEAVLDVVGPLVRQHGLIVLPEQTEIVAEERYQSKSGSAMRSVTVRVTWSITGPAGDTMVAQTLGEAADASDKAVAKAQSVAGRVLWLTGLWVPTGDPDPDEQTHERAPQQQRPRGRRPQQDLPSRPSEPDDEAVLSALYRDIDRWSRVLGLAEGESTKRFIAKYGTAPSLAGVQRVTEFRDALRREAEERQAAQAAPTEGAQA